MTVQELLNQINREVMSDPDLLDAHVEVEVAGNYADLILIDFHQSGAKRMLFLNGGR